MSATRGSCGLVASASFPGWLVREYRLRPGYAMDAHRHAAGGVVLAVSGMWVAKVGSQRLELPAGEMLVLPAETTHRERCGAAGAHVLLLTVDGAPPAENREAARDLADLRRLYGPAVSPLGRALLRALRAPDPWDPPAVEELLVRLFDGRPELRVPGTIPPWLGRVRARIRDDLPRRAAVGELAREAGVSREHLTRVFARVERRSIGHFVEAARLDRAVLELRETAVPITTIAHRCGFADHSHLTRAFRRRFGITPRAFRTACRTAPSSQEEECPAS